MSKIVQAINAMIANKQYITNVTPGEIIETEYYFLYKNKYAWSILKDTDGEHLLFYYPNIQSTEYLAQMTSSDANHIAAVTYSDLEIGTKEAKASFSELHTIIKEKIYGISDVLDDIISDLDF
ncbi:hypothetical protein GCM10027276_14490 [Comamonas piscis]